VLPAGGHVLAAQQHTDALISALLASRARSAETAALQQYLDDAHAVARAAVSAVNGTAEPPAAAAAVMEELGVRPGPGAAASALASRSGGPRRQRAPVTAFGVTIADIMLDGRHDDPDPVIAAWLAGNTASRRNTTSPADVLIHWGQASPALKAALARPLAARLDTFYQLRYRAVAGPARIPDPACARERAAALPSLMWPGWALRLMPPGDYDFLRYRAALAIMLAVAVTGAEDYRTAQELLGLDPFHSSRLAPSPPGSARTASWNGSPWRSASSHANSTNTVPRSTTPPTAAAPLVPGPARHRRLASPALLSHPPRDLGAAPPPRPCQPARRPSTGTARPAPPHRAARRHPPPLPARAAAAARPPQPGLRRVRVHHARADGLLPAPASPHAALQSQHQRARHLGTPIRVGYQHPWPGPDPDTISTEDLHPLIRAGLPVRAIAARLATSADHVRLAAARHPAPQLPAGNPAPPPPEPEPPGTEQLRDLTSQGYGPRKIARITGYSERAIRQLLTSAGLRHPAPLPDGGIDPRWLREHYQDRERSLKDIAAETSVPVEALAAAARKAGIRVRHGIAGRAHPLAALGGPGAFPADVWNVFTRPGAEQRIRRLLALPGQPGLQHAAHQLGIWTAMLTSQVNQLESAVGTALLRTGPDGRLTLTAYGQLFARDVAPVLKMLTPL
jgi:hypothetical protein